CCHRLGRALGALGLAALAARAVWAAQLPPGQNPLPGGSPSFERDVLPTLKARCLRCHGDGARKGGLDLRTLASLLRGGSNGPVLVKGAAVRSRLFEQISQGAMPPGKAAKLTPGQVATIRDWINAGAPGEAKTAAEAGPVTAVDRRFWSFRP